MGMKAILGVLTSGLLNFTPATSHIPGLVTTKYDEFKDRTTITLIGEQIKGQPIFYGLAQFDGLSPKPSETFELGFLVGGACDSPNFLADGKRVEPNRSAKNLSGRSEMRLFTSGGEITNFFTYNFYYFPQIKQIATSKTIQYQICDRVFKLSSQDQTYLRQFISHFSSLSQK